ncbi:MAG TPA: sigma-70 family RNA polymerase sigma factor [Thermoanaerobaculia bacterium]|nr:sigma-70 family RNA polymerase sigma factor [Thermoanaerobaculia bacterium]
MGDRDDLELVLAIKAGDLEAFSELLARYERPLFNAAYRITLDAEDARDATQNAMVRVFTQLHTFDTDARFFSWCYRIVVNEALRARERRERRREHDQLPDVPEPSDQRGDPERGTEAKETAALVHAALSDLGHDYRTVVVLRHFQGLSYAEMAEVLEIPEKTVKSRLFSARSLLRRRLAAIRACTG